ncbi:MAG: hypothetical protein ABSG76_08020 [Xanthobacteraceae bacterium]
MNDKSEIAARLTSRLERAAAFRAAAKADATIADGRQRLRAWQTVRLARSHADLLASRRFGPAATFFLADLYSANDISARDEQVRTVVPVMTAVLPAWALEIAADAIELDALSEDLDAAMMAALGPRIGSIDAEAYGRAYRKVDRRADRERQIQLIRHIGQSLERLARQRIAGMTLSLMRKPAQVAGLSDLQEFLERGYAAVRRMGRADEFLDLAIGREQKLLEALFAGDDSMLEEGPEPQAA